MNFRKSIENIISGLRSHGASPSNLRQLQEQHDVIMANIAAAVVIYNSEGETGFVSPYTEVLTGYELESIAEDESDFLEHLVLPEYRDIYLRAKQVALVGEDMLVRYQIKHKNNMRLWLETRFVPILDEEANISSILALSVDLTESMTYQKVVEQQNQDLQDFAYMVSHDLKAPVSTIRGMASGILEDYANILGEAGKEQVNYILDATNRLNSLIASVIEYSSLATKELEEEAVDLNEVLESVLSDLAKSIEESNGKIKIEPNLPMVWGSRVRIYQVFSNLVGNAIKYRVNERPLVIVIAKKAHDDEFVTLQVRDNGSGIQAAKLGEIFRPFKRAHGADIAGSGVGLACVKKIVEKLGGNVSVESVEGAGNTFTVSLPLPAQEPQAVPRKLKKLYSE